MVRRFDDSTRTFVTRVPYLPRGRGTAWREHAQDGFLGGGHMLAIYGVASPTADNPYTGTVYYTWSLDSGRSWSAGRPLFDSRNSFDQRYSTWRVCPRAGRCRVAQ